MRSGALNAIRPCTSSPRAASTSSNLSAMGTGGRPARPPRPNPVPPPPVPPRPVSTGVGGGGGGGGGAGPGGAVPPEGGAAGDGGASRRPDARNSSNDAPTSTRSTNTTGTSVRSPVVIRTGTVAAAHGWLQDVHVIARDRAKISRQGATPPPTLLIPGRAPRILHRTPFIPG